MQLYFLSFLSSSLFFFEVVVKIFDYFWKPSSLFSKFCVNCFWCTTSYTVIFVLWKILTEPVNAQARWWPCAWLKCVSGPRRLEENFEFFEVHAYHWPGAQTWFRHKWRKLITASLLIPCIDWYGCPVIGMSFFQLCFMFYIEVFSYCTLTETYAIGLHKWFDHEWIDFGFFCWEMAYFVDFISVWTEICKNCSIVFLFWRHQIFSMFCLRGILVCSLKMLVLFSHRIL